MSDLTGAKSDVEPQWGGGDVFISIGVWFGLQIVVAVVFVAAGGVDLEAGSDPATALDDIGVGWLAVFLVSGWIGWLLWPFIVVRTRGLGSFRRDLGWSIERGDIWPGIVGGGTLLLVGIVVTLFWVLVTGGGDPPDNTQAVPEATSPLTFVVLFLLVAVAAPIVEELFFRGFLLRVAAKKWSMPIGVVASSLVFGLVHFQGQGVGDLAIMSQLGLYGYVLGVLTVRRRGRLGAATIAHGINNGMVVVLLTLS